MVVIETPPLPQSTEEIPESMPGGSIELESAMERQKHALGFFLGG